MAFRRNKEAAKEMAPLEELCAVGRAERGKQA